MPTYRSINISLRSQFEIQTLPEYHPLPQAHYTARGIPYTVPKPIDDASSTCSVYVPVYPGSTFWITYSVSPPVPDGHYFLFKLYIDGAHVVSWSTGKEEGWKGKTMFGLFERAEEGEGKRRVEKRVLCFASEGLDGGEGDVEEGAFDEEMRMEIRVHRAHGRKRVERELEMYGGTEHAAEARGIELVNAGRASAEQPKRFYRFALIDPVDQPFATFMYFYRTRDQLRYLGLLEDEEQGGVIDNDLPVIEPCEDSFVGEDEKSSSLGSEDLDGMCYEAGYTSDIQDVLNGHQSSTSKRSGWSTNVYEAPRGYIPRGAPSTSSGAEASGERKAKQTRHRHSGMHTPPQYHRLSMLPSVKLDPPQPCPKPQLTGPRKSDSSSSTSYRPHPAYPFEKWRQRTPSPVKSVRDGITTPPLEKHKQQGFRASSLVNVFTSTWRRRGNTGGLDPQSGARSVSH
ncbi:hypothetical protein DE146DRAFT_788060 [Phaeosphaeria sp. MPI-PUGE-AT-0046c]|nr:hypothetical protein DE146DRAFT_788060 [Phaeosphaeria sp. MPI-PUGE-AT-0046c]